VGGAWQVALAAPFSCVKDKCHSFVPSFTFKKIKQSRKEKPGIVPVQIDF